MASKEDIENINKSIETISNILQALTTRVNTIEQNKVTAAAMGKIKEQMSKIYEDFTYVERPPTPLDMKDRLPEKFSTADIPKFKPTDNPIKEEVDHVDGEDVENGDDEADSDNGGDDNQEVGDQDNQDDNQEEQGENNQGDDEKENDDEVNDDLEEDGEDEDYEETSNEEADTSTDEDSDKENERMTVDPFDAEGYDDEGDYSDDNLYDSDPEVDSNDYGTGSNNNTSNQYHCSHYRRSPDH
ncbi:prostatic spermine-binding protein-like [Chenopodium quinoa]|uniref:prostatic spermine-binding protein-like n=1 Tax=Chenopodium quinoa TaxID=63459 RepID=UPI000B77F6AD|nr:prostatic spermine-binding protein-like [Chenopodium quinoa]